MKILQVAYKSDISGGEKVLYDLATSLKERGHEIVAVCPDPGQLPDELRKIGIKTKIIPYHKTYDLRAARRLSRFIREEKVEVLHSHSMLTNILSRLAGRWGGVPVSVSTRHQVLELARGGRGTGPVGKLKGHYYGWLDNYTSRHNDVVVAVSHAVKRDLVEQGVEEERIIVIRNGIRIADPASIAARGKGVKEELGIAPEKVVVGTVGRLTPPKGQDDLLRAAWEILKVFPETFFLVIGDGPWREKLEELADTLGISHRIKFTGYWEDVLVVHSIMNIFVLASHWEGMPLSILEAMSLGRPVVATSVSGTAEAVVNGETGFLVPLGDYRSLALAIVELVKDPAKAEKMGEAGRRRAVEHFSLERMVDEHEALYKDLLRGVRGEGAAP